MLDLNEYLSSISDSVLEGCIKEIYELYTGKEDLEHVFLLIAERDFENVDTEIGYINALLMEYSFRSAKLK